MGRMLVFLLLGCTAVNAKIKSSFNFKDMTKYHGLRIEHETALLTFGAKSDIKFWKEKDELLVLDANMIITGNLDVRSKLTAKGSSVGNGGAATPAQILKIFKGWNTHFRCEAGWYGVQSNRRSQNSKINRQGFLPRWIQTLVSAQQERLDDNLQCHGKEHQDLPEKTPLAYRHNQILER